MLLVTVVAVAIGVLSGFLIAVAIAHRVRRLAQSAGRMAAGSFDASLSVSGPDEIGDLARGRFRRAEVEEQRRNVARAGTRAAFHAPV